MTRVLVDFDSAGPDDVIQTCVDVTVDDQGYAEKDLWAAALRLAADQIDRH